MEKKHFVLSFRVKMSKHRKKRETKDDLEEWKTKSSKMKFPSNQICILPFKGINSSSLSLEGKVPFLHQFREKGLKGTVDSKLRIQAVCEFKHESVEHITLDTTRWHQGCH